MTNRILLIYVTSVI